jgi:hypothetical protein
VCASIGVSVFALPPAFFAMFVCAFVCLRAQPPTRLTWQLDNDVLEMAGEALACAEGEIENLDLMVGGVPRGVLEYPGEYPWSTPWSTP